MKHYLAPIAILLAAFAGQSVSAQQPAATGAQWVTLGTSGGPAVQVERSQIANALVVGDAIYLFDVGNGVRRQMAKAGLREAQVKAVFLTHHHVDHNADLGPLMLSHWLFTPGKLAVLGPEGTKMLVAGLADANRPTVLASFPTDGPAKAPLADSVTGTDLPVPMETPRLVYQDDAIRVEAIDVPHYQVAPSVPMDRMPRAVAYRVTAGGRVFVYSGDTGPTDRLALLARGADILVTEVVEPEAIAALLTKNMANAPASARRSIIDGMSHNHLAPAEIGRIAEKAGVGQVVLTHFVPSPEQAPDPQAYVRDIASRYKGKVIMANDLDRF